MSPTAICKSIRLTIASILLVLCAGACYGQNTLIRGIVLDQRGLPLPGATIFFKKQNDPLRGPSVETAADGLFTMADTSNAPAELHISHIGYQEFVQTITPRADHDAGRVDTFHLQPKARALPEIQVTAGKPFMVDGGDKKIFNTDKMAAVAGGNAGDVLQSVPLVVVDKDGNVSLRGQNANVLIDGKPSPFSDAATTLQMISSGAIDKVEVITNPSAKYEAEGQGGIVNIVLKKNTETGFRGLLNLDAGSLPDEHAGTDLSYRGKHLHLYGNVNYHTRAIEGRQSLNQYFAAGDSAYELSQSAQSRVHNHDLDARLGLDLIPSDHTTISLTQTFAQHLSKREITSDIDSGAWQKVNSPFALHSTRSQMTNRNYTTTLEFVHRFAKPSEQIDASLTYAGNLVNTDIRLGNSSRDSLFWERSGETNDPSLWTAQADYVLPIGKGRLEAGYKGEFRSGGDNVNAFTADGRDTFFSYSPALSTRFGESSAVQALYTTWSGHIGTIHYATGVRAEYATETGASYLQPVNFRRRFVNLFPSLFLSKDLAHGQNIGISFATRITRPTFTQLLPYVNNSNPLNYTTGNPALSPAYTRNLELNYNHSFSPSGDFLSFSAYFSQTSDNIQPVTQKDSSGGTLTRPENIGYSQKAGSDLIYRFRLGRAVHFTTTVDGNYTQFSRQARYWSATLKLTGDISLPANLPCSPVEN